MVASHGNQITHFTKLPFDTFLSLAANIASIHPAAGQIHPQYARPKNNELINNKIKAIKLPPILPSLAA